MDIIEFTGNARVLALCLNLAKKRGLIGRDAEESAFRVACCRPIDRTRAEDLAHLAAALEDAAALG